MTADNKRKSNGGRRLSLTDRAKVKPDTILLVIRSRMVTPLRAFSENPE